MAKYANRAVMETATTGTGTMTLGAAVANYQTFAAAGISNGDVVGYVIEDGAEWEIGTGTYSSAGPTLTRNVIESSNSNSPLDSPISLSGAARVFIDVPATFFNASEDYGLITSAPTAFDDYGSLT